MNKDKMLRPNICLICEHRPNERVVDTGFNMKRTTITEILRGRKYVCSRCGELVNKALGFPNVHQMESLKNELIHAQNRIVELEGLNEVTEVLVRLEQYVLANGGNDASTVDDEESTS